MEFVRTPTLLEMLQANVSTFMTPSKMLVAVGIFIVAFIVISMVRSVRSLFSKLMFAIVIVVLALFVLYYLNPPTIYF